MALKATEIGALIASGLLVACGDGASRASDAVMPAIWVGAVHDSDVRVALARRSGGTALFFCGGDTTYATKTRWFSSAEPLDAPFVFTDAGWEVRGELQGERAEGSIREGDGAPEPWGALAVVPDTLAGLYEGSAPCGKIALIVTQPTPRATPSAQGACLPTDTTASPILQVNPVKPLTRGAGGAIRVRVGADTTQEFKVHPVLSAPR